MEYREETHLVGFTNRVWLNSKTIVFTKVIENCVKKGERVLILAHRAELLEQASDKLFKTTGLMCSVEKAEQSSLDSWFRVTVGSIQTLQNSKRLKQFDNNYFDVIIVDEAHHILSKSYQKVLEHFSNADVLGVTATPDRGDKKNLGQFFESLAYEYTLPKAIKEGYLSPIKALTIPINLDLTKVSISQGDFKASDVDTALDPYLQAICEEMKKYCLNRKTVVFLPLVATAQKFMHILNDNGFNAAEVNGSSKDRAEILNDFQNNKYNVLCNAMLLTEGWDCPDVDCIIMLRPTKIRSLYCQAVGRGTRLSPSKKDLLLLDFLWHTERHELCHPASLICTRDKVAQKMTTNMMEQSGQMFDIEEAEEQAKSDVQAEREEALASQLKEMRMRKRKLVDPVQFEMSIQAEDLSSYEPVFGWECAPASPKQLKALEAFGIFPDQIPNAGYASLLLNRLNKRSLEGLSTPKQIRFLESKGFLHVGQWTFNDASNMIQRFATNGWRTPIGIDINTYVPESKRTAV